MCGLQRTPASSITYVFVARLSHPARLTPADRVDRWRRVVSRRQFLTVAIRARDAFTRCRLGLTSAQSDMENGSMQSKNIFELIANFVQQNTYQT